MAESEWEGLLLLSVDVVVDGQCTCCPRVESVAVICTCGHRTTLRCRDWVMWCFVCGQESRLVNEQEKKM